MNGKQKFIRSTATKNAGLPPPAPELRDAQHSCSHHPVTPSYLTSPEEPGGGPKAEASSAGEDGKGDGRAARAPGAGAQLEEAAPTPRSGEPKRWGEVSLSSQQPDPGATAPEPKALLQEEPHRATAQQLGIQSS